MYALAFGVRRMNVTQKKRRNINEVVDLLHLLDTKMPTLQKADTYKREDTVYSTLALWGTLDVDMAGIFVRDCLLY